MTTERYISCQTCHKPAGDQHTTRTGQCHDCAAKAEARQEFAALTTEQVKDVADLDGDSRRRELARYELETRNETADDDDSMTQEESDAEEFSGDRDDEVGTPHRA